MRWLLLFAVACSDRPIYIPEEVRHIDAPDLAYSDLTVPACGWDCKCDGAPCAGDLDCCTSLCIDGLCRNVAALDLASSCNGHGDCVVSGCSCTATADCCAGLVCFSPAGSLHGTCVPPPPPPDMACTEGVPSGGQCTGTWDCCGPGVICIVPLGSISGTCTDCTCAACGGACITLEHCCTTDSDCCTGMCGLLSDGSRVCVEL
jgi:hypothetical protein